MVNHISGGENLTPRLFQDDEGIYEIEDPMSDTRGLLQRCTDEIVALRKAGDLEGADIKRMEFDKLVAASQPYTDDGGCF